MVDQDTNSQALATSSETALVPTNPAIQKTALSLRWRPETLVERVKKALPSPLAQSLYVLAAKDWEAMHPETFAKLLDYFVHGTLFHSSEEQNTRLSAILLHDEGLGLGEFMEEAFSLLGKIADSDTPSLSATTVARLVMAYGEDAEAIVELVEVNLHEILDALNWRLSRSFPQQKAIASIIGKIAAHAADGGLRGGMPNVINMDDVIELLSRYPAAEYLIDEEE
ncbi:MAG: hypothetical protein A2Z42_03880 [Candidatus Woykebacteria bacterium RBG_19FT_COMBO_43_10]|uniref:Uncharacterized protein n=1 Tax=Candidatus Woykebacteria bacterium RBG_19FT_COMBO_43_10 TaxID=1802598 RepID=A0A1G1WLF3_9BACT|nr:MAG: hypothetical protein A2Z42_03880 [Candidatus Woykebacteria bacterium RBG_19FT_COMBO_43_10]